MGNRRWNGMLLLILCAMLLSACSKQPKCSGQTRSDAAAAAETTDAPAIALTVASGRYNTGFFTSDKLSVVSAAAANENEDKDKNPRAISAKVTVTHKKDLLFVFTTYYAENLFAVTEAFSKNF